MSVFSEEQYQAILDGLASGTTNVSYGGKTVTYRSLDEMMRVVRIMQRCLGISQKNYSTTLRYKNPRARRWRY